MAAKPLIALSYLNFSLPPCLRIFASALLLLQPVISRVAARGPATPSGRGQALIGVSAIATCLLVATYGGYFGAGAGILFLGGMGALVARPLGEINALKVFVTVVTNTIAALTFVALEAREPTGALVWRAAIPLAVGSIAGGWVGVHVVRRLPAAALRTFAAAVGVGIALWLAVR